MHGFTWHHKVKLWSETPSPALSCLSYGLISPSLPLLVFSPSPDPALFLSRVRTPSRLPVEVASLLSNSVRRLKGGNYIHAARPLWTLSSPSPPPAHWQLVLRPTLTFKRWKQGLWKCLSVHDVVCVSVCNHVKKELLKNDTPTYTSTFICLKSI